METSGSGSPIHSYSEEDTSASEGASGYSDGLGDSDFDSECSGCEGY